MNVSLCETARSLARLLARDTGYVSSRKNILSLVLRSRLAKYLRSRLANETRTRDETRLLASIPRNIQKLLHILCFTNVLFSFVC